MQRMSTERVWGMGNGALSLTLRCKGTLPRDREEQLAVLPDVPLLINQAAVLQVIHCKHKQLECLWDGCGHGSNISGDLSGK